MGNKLLTYFLNTVVLILLFTALSVIAWSFLAWEARGYSAYVNGAFWGTCFQLREPMMFGSRFIYEISTLLFIWILPALVSLAIWWRWIRPRIRNWLASLRRIGKENPGLVALVVVVLVAVALVLLLVGFAALGFCTGYTGPTGYFLENYSGTRTTFP